MKYIWSVEMSLPLGLLRKKGKGEDIKKQRKRSRIF